MGAFIVHSKGSRCWINNDVDVVIGARAGRCTILAETCCKSTSIVAPISSLGTAAFPHSYIQYKVTIYCVKTSSYLNPHTSTITKHKLWKNLATVKSVILVQDTCTYHHMATAHPRSITIRNSGIFSTTVAYQQLIIHSCLFKTKLVWSLQCDLK